MLGQVWNILVLILLLNFSINARGESTTASFPTVAENTTATLTATVSTDSTTTLKVTEKPAETVSTDSTTTLKTTEKPTETVSTDSTTTLKVTEKPAETVSTDSTTTLKTTEKPTETVSTDSTTTLKVTEKPAETVSTDSTTTLKTTEKPTETVSTDSTTTLKVTEKPAETVSTDSTTTLKTTEKPTETVSTDSTTTLKVTEKPAETVSTDSTTTLKLTEKPTETVSTDSTTTLKVTEKPAETVSTDSTTTLKVTEKPAETVSTDSTTTLKLTEKPTETVSTDSTTTLKVTEKPAETVSTDSTTTLETTEKPTETVSTDSITTLKVTEKPTEKVSTDSTTTLKTTNSPKPETTTTKSPDNQTIENITMNTSKIQTTESLKFNSTDDTTTNFLDAKLAIETTTNHIKSHDDKSYFPHPGKPHWGHVEPSEPAFAQSDMIPSTDEFIQNIILQLAEYINNQTNSDLSELSSSLTNLIANELKNKLDQSELDLNAQDLENIRGTAKVVLKNLPFIINTIISNIKKVGDENCPIKFEFFNNVYCIKFEFNLATSRRPTIPSSLETATNSPANISIESFKVFNINHIDTPPTSWQRWFNPPVAQDQTSSTTNEPAVVCYYTNWAQYRNGPGRFYPENIDPNLCTHIIYAFAQLSNGVIAAYEWNDESTQWSTGMYARIMNLRKTTRPKILLAIGGWNHGSGKFSDMVHNETKRATFITTTIIFLQKHKFDGLDIDWEYPGSRDGSRPTDKDDYTKLIIELKTAFRPYSLLLTAAVGAGKPTIDAGYDIPKVCENLDLVNLMAYDLHGSWESQTGIHVALYSRQNDTELNKQLTVDWAVRYWISNGCSPSKLVLGLALYGRTFGLANSMNNKIGAPAVGPGSAGLYTGEAGFLAYYEICTRVQQQSWTKVFDEEQKSNYAYKGLEWVGYDDVYSINFKVRYAQDMGLAGIMFWAPDLDDFTGGLCNEGKYPLMNTAVNLIRGQTEWTTPTKPSTTTTTTTTMAPTPAQQKRVVCYYTNWAQYRPDGGKFLPENLDASLCTHIIYAFAVLKDSKLTSYEWNDQDTEWSKGMYSRILALKKSNNIKILLAVGGWNFGSGAFSDMVGNDQLRKEFVQQATQFIQDHQFDGLDIDWEYPGSREGSRPQDKQLFTTLVKELKIAFQPYNLLLTAAVGAGASTIENGYEIDKLVPHLDFINLMTYDFHGGSWENFTGLHTALYARPEENQEQMTFNQNWAVNQWIHQGMPKEKISMGLATYGRTYKLADNSSTGIGAPCSGPGEPGKYTQEAGFLAYYEICEKLNSGLWTSKYDDVQKSMYAYGEGMWVGYDNIDTLTIRANYIIGKDLGGVMIWAPDLDDFSGKFCNRGPYPLMNTVVNIIRTDVIVPIVIPTDPTTTTTTTTTTTPATTTSTLSTTLPPIISPSLNIIPPSVVCMTTVNPFVFNTLNVNLCSHLILIQTGVLPSDTDIFQSALSSDTLEQLKIMKKTNEKLKIFYSILGQWKPKHLDLIRDNQQRTTFNQQIKQYLIDNNLDGFDIDWNIPADQISALTDKYLLSTWLIELRNAFISNQLSLSIGISGDKTVLDSSYDFSKISNTVDFIRLMAFDFDWQSKNVTNLVNPLFAVNNDQYNNINWVVNYMITFGIPPEQISLGIPTYGRWFGLADGNQNTIGSPIIGSSIRLAYSDICKLLKNDEYIQEYNQPSRSSYSFNIKKKQWISFDTINDVNLKARFAKLDGLGGVTLSSVGMDDVDGQCGQGSYPLLHAVADVFDLNTNDQTRNVNNQNKHSKQQNIFCSVSSNIETYSSSIKFTLDKIDTHLCTHLLIDNNSSLLSDGLKIMNSNLKLLLTINADENWNINQLKEDIHNKKADGINIEINSNAFSDKISDLIKTIQSVLSKEYLFTISFQLPTDPSYQVLFFNLLELHKLVDYLIILPFNSKSIENFKEIQPWNNLATFLQSDPVKNIGDFSMVSALMFILSAGVPKEKLIMSIPTYGLSFVLDDENKYQIGDQISTPGLPGSITHTTGILASYEICDRIQLNNYERFLSNQSITVVAHDKKNFIIFDDTQPLELNNNILINGTVELKAVFIKRSQLAGVLVHSIDMDDYTGLSCHHGAFPITSIVSRIFSTPIPLMPPSTTTTTTTTPIVEKKISPCSGVKTRGLVADGKDCSYFYVCMPDRDEPIAHLECPSNMVFSLKQKACTQDRFACSTNSKFNSMSKSMPQSQVSSTKSEIPFVCPIPSGVFPDASDCTQFFACTNNLIVPMKCPPKTKFNSVLKRCDWMSSSCP